MIVISWFEKLIDRLFALAGAALFFQLPNFMHQYVHELKGHVAELNILIQTLSKTASISGKTLKQYVNKFLSSQDSDFVLQGEFMNNIINRYENLNNSYQAITDANLYSKPWVFLKHFDWSLGESTWSTFTPGFSFSLESIGYGFFGLIFGLVLYKVLSKCVLKVKNLFSRKKLA